MSFGTIASFDALMSDWDELDIGQKLEMTRVLRALDYESFLDTRYWYAIRLRVYFLRKTCGACGIKVHGQIHHRHYRNHGLEHLNLGDLRNLCDTCHGIITEAVATIREGGV